MLIIEDAGEMIRGGAVADEIARLFSTQEFKASGVGVCVVLPSSVVESLAVDVVSALELEVGAESVSLLCLWEVALEGAGLPYSTVVKQYFDGSDGSEADLILLDDGSSPVCLLVSRITRSLSLLKPKRIHVCVPHISAESKDELLKEFPTHISSAVSFLEFGAMFELGSYSTSQQRSVGVLSTEDRSRCVPEFVKKRRANKFGLEMDAFIRNEERHV